MNAYRGASTSWSAVYGHRMELSVHRAFNVDRVCVAHTAAIRRPNQFDWWNGTASMANTCVCARTTTAWLHDHISCSSSEIRATFVNLKLDVCRVGVRLHWKCHHSFLWLSNWRMSPAKRQPAINDARCNSFANLMRNKCSQLKLSVAKNENNWKFDGRCAMHGCQESIRKWDIFITYSFDIRRNRDNEHAMRFTAHLCVCAPGRGRMSGKEPDKTNEWCKNAHEHAKAAPDNSDTMSTSMDRETDRQTTITCAMPFDCCHCYSLAAVAVCPLLRIVMHSGAWLSTLQ